jgi:rhodanese-related sulfurtransferase
MQLYQYLLSLEAWADFKTLSTSEVQAKIKQGVAIIDIRRQDEYDKYGVIPVIRRPHLVLIFYQILYQGFVSLAGVFVVLNPLSIQQ